MRWISTIGLCILSARADDCSWNKVMAKGENNVGMNTTNPYIILGGIYSFQVLDSTGEDIVPTSLTDCTTDLECVLDYNVKVNGPKGGKFTAHNDTYSCNVNFGPFPEGQFIYISPSAVDFYNSAVQMAGGSVATGEYYLDLSGNQIHLLPDATSDKPAAENWIVWATSEPANLSDNPDDTLKNPQYAPAMTGKMITAAQWKDINEYYYNTNVLGELIQTSAEFVWTPGTAIDSPVPSVNGTQAHIEGVAGLWRIGEGPNFTVIPGDAYAPAAAVASWVPLNFDISPPEGPSLPTPTMGPTARPPPPPETDAAGLSALCGTAVLFLISLL